MFYFLGNQNKQKNDQKVVFSCKHKVFGRLSNEKGLMLEKNDYYALKVSPWGTLCYHDLGIQVTHKFHMVLHNFHYDPLKGLGVPRLIIVL